MVRVLYALDQNDPRNYTKLLKLKLASWVFVDRITSFCDSSSEGHEFRVGLVST